MVSNAPEYDLMVDHNHTGPSVMPSGQCSGCDVIHRLMDRIMAAGEPPYPGV